MAGATGIFAGIGRMLSAQPGGAGRGGDPSLGTPSIGMPNNPADPVVQALMRQGLSQAQAVQARLAGMGGVTRLQPAGGPGLARLAAGINAGALIQAQNYGATQGAGTVAVSTAPAAGYAGSYPVPLAGGGGGGAALSQAGPTQGRRQNLGFPSTAITTLAQANVVSAPQTWFRPDRAFIASTSSAFFAVASILVGNKEQFVNANPCPSAMFSELAVNADVEYDTCEPAVSITLQLTSLDTTATRTVVPGMTGRSAY